MTEQDLKKAIKDVGMKIFVKYYHVFKELDRDKAICAITEEFTKKAKGRVMIGIISTRI